MKTKIFALALALLALGSNSACAGNTARAEAQQGNNEAKDSHIKPISAKSMRELVFDYKENPTKFVFKGKRPAIIDFYADWCGPCRQLTPRLEKIAKKYEGQIDVYKVNIDYEQELAKFFGVRSIPMLLFIPMGETPSQSLGLLSEKQLEEGVQHILKSVKK